MPISSIKELAEVKQRFKENFYLKPNIILESCNKYKGYYYCITFNVLLGCRCAYIAISNNHRFANRITAENELQVHGGITFHGIPHLINNQIQDEIWIGFDAYHWDDSPDLALTKKFSN